MGVRAEVYHANIGPSAREEVHKKFITDQAEVIVATVAYGMGIGSQFLRQMSFLISQVSYSDERNRRQAGRPQDHSFRSCQIPGRVLPAG